MATIQDYLELIKNAIYGKDVRQAIHDGIQQCYYDGHAGAVDLSARQRLDADEANITSLTSRISTAENDIDVLVSRVDQIVAPSGEAPSAAEVSDARVGADGTIYTSLGDAVRGQVTDLKSDFKQQNLYVFDWKNRIYFRGQGVWDDSSTRIGLQSVLTAKSDIRFKTTNGYKVSITTFTSEIASLETETGKASGWVTEYTLSKGEHFLINLAKNDDSSISVLEASNLLIESLSWEEQEIINNSLVGLRDYTNLATWEIGSIYSDGSEYNDNTWSIRTPRASKIPLTAGIEVRTINPLIQTMLLFRYENEIFKERIGTVGKKSVSVSTAGDYRIVLIKPNYVPIDSSEISLYSDGFSAMATTLSEITANMNQSYLYHVYGKKIDLSAQGFNVEQASYSLPSPASIAEGLTARQDFDIYNGILFQLYSDNYVSLIDLETGSIITSYAIDCGHGNSCQFSDEFYDSADAYPLLYCFGYSNNLVYVNRVTDSGATLIRTYKLNTNGYRFSGGLDIKNNRIISIHYEANSSTSETDNHSIITAWDLNNVTTDSNDGTLIPDLIEQITISFVGVVQGCAFFKGVLYVISGYYSTGYPVKLTGFDVNGTVVSEITDFPTAIVQNEGEGISFYKVDNKYKCYFATANLYELIFE